MRRDLSLSDYGQLLGCWVLLLGADLALRLLPFRLVERLAAPPARRLELPPEAAGAWVIRMHRLVGIAARRHLYPMTCLRRSLVLRWLLGRAGIPTALRLGVRREGKALEAHAWVEYAGQPVGEPEDLERYTPLELPLRPR